MRANAATWHFTNRTETQKNRRAHGERRLPMKEITLKAFDKKDAWQVALKAPIPANASVELLGKIRENVIGYLDWYSNDGPSGIPREQMRIDLTEAVDRL